MRGEASPHAPKTMPGTGSYVRSLASTGPMVPAGVRQKRWSRWRALAAYSAGSVRALRATASQRWWPPTYVEVPTPKDFSCISPLVFLNLFHPAFV